MYASDVTSSGGATMPASRRLLGAFDFDVLFTDILSGGGVLPIQRQTCLRIGRELPHEGRPGAVGEFAKKPSVVRANANWL
jgi:hypothetical protein